MSTQILKVYNKNILVLSRGLEDAIFKRDHIKISSEDGFIARGICIKATMMTSHWKIYRVTRPELVSKDTLYNMKSINQSKIPKDLRKFAKVDFSKWYNDFGDKDVEKQLKLQNKRIAEYDLPKRVKDTDAFKEKNESGLEKFITRNFDKNQLTEDMKRTYFEIYADPLSSETRDDKSKAIFGASLYNIGTKYQYDINMAEHQVKYPSYHERRTHYDVEFKINRFSENMSLISRYDYDRDVNGGRYFPLRRQQIGLIGVRYHIWEENERSKFFDITYIPTYDRFEYSLAGSDDEESREGLRHTFRIRAYTKLTNLIHWRSEFLWRPMSSVSKDGGSSDGNPYAFVNIGYELREDFFFEYNFTYEKDSLLREVYNVPAENVSNNIQFKYAWRL